ncbi:MAG: hypothetical protein ACP5L0_01360 [Caldisphaera sp.]|jgi:uncharacterized transporter YbjL|uniref:hypothetical protein n=1 Tax=Caldisphaera sp. TaxID=2060322 RepID=UPI000CB2E92D|nr:MAG: hypothetical protein C0202_00430 [Caldisphaera sp.]
MISDIILYSFLILGIALGILMNISKKFGKKSSKALNMLVMISILDLIFFMAITAGEFISRYLSGGESLSLIYSIILYSFLPSIIGVLIAFILLGGKNGK